MLNDNDLNLRLISLAVKIVDLCSPASREILKRYLDKELIPHQADDLLGFAVTQMNNCKLDLDDDTFSIVQKLRETIVLLELLRESQMVSENQIYPIVVECGELLDMLQHQLN